MSGGCEAGREHSGWRRTRRTLRATSVPDRSARPPQPGSASLSVGGVRSGERDARAQARDAAQSAPGMADANAGHGPSQRPQEVYVDHEAEDARELGAAALAGRHGGGTDEVSRTGHHRDADRRRSGCGRRSGPRAWRGEEPIAWRRARTSSPGEPGRRAPGLEPVPRGSPGVGGRAGPAPMRAPPRPGRGNLPVSRGLGGDLPVAPCHPKFSTSGSHPSGGRGTTCCLRTAEWRSQRHMSMSDVNQ